MGQIKLSGLLYDLCQNVALQLRPIVLFIRDNFLADDLRTHLQLGQVAADVSGDPLHVFEREITL
jgi:hypothetical protein